MPIDDVSKYNEFMIVSKIYSSNLALVCNATIITKMLQEDTIRLFLTGGATNGTECIISQVNISKTNLQLVASYVNTMYKTDSTTLELYAR